jgi:hypothetical protein
MNNLAPYLFVEINKKIAAKKALGEEIINFSIGDPDIPTPENVINMICRTANDPANHRYLRHSGYLNSGKRWLPGIKSVLNVILDRVVKCCLYWVLRKALHILHYVLSTP